MPPEAGTGGRGRQHGLKARTGKGTGGRGEGRGWTTATGSKVPEQRVWGSVAQVSQRLERKKPGGGSQEQENAVGVR